MFEKVSKTKWTKGKPHHSMHWCSYFQPFSLVGTQWKWDYCKQQRWVHNAELKVQKCGLVWAGFWCWALLCLIYWKSKAQLISLTVIFTWRNFYILSLMFLYQIVVVCLFVLLLYICASTFIHRFMHLFEWFLLLKWLPSPPNYT